MMTENNASQKFQISETINQLPLKAYHVIPVTNTSLLQNQYSLLSFLIDSYRNSFHFLAPLLFALIIIITNQLHTNAAAHKFSVSVKRFSQQFNSATAACVSRCHHPQPNPILHSPTSPFPNTNIQY